MRVIKRSGKTQKFNIDKIKVAIIKASENVEQDIPHYMIDRIANRVEEEVYKTEKKSIKTSEISKIVEDALMSSTYKDIARSYIENRHTNDMIQQVNTTDSTLMELLQGTNEYWNSENSNKDPHKVHVLRDYVAGITNTDLAKRYIFDKDLIEAHENGELHIHDLDYAAEPRHNCELANLNDMLQNGTVLNGIKIEKPKRFITACTVATQLMVAISSSSYGGITVTTAHLAPFVRDSYNIHYNKYKDYGLDEEDCKKLAELDTKKEVRDGVQTFNYQINSMYSTNGQAPFSTVSLWINENKKFVKENAMIIEEFLNQRITGMKAPDGKYITVAFPKLIFILDEKSFDKNWEYYYLTELAAKCSAKRLVPDYVSAKIMREEKIDKFGNGCVYPPMGKCKLQPI